MTTSANASAADFGDLLNGTAHPHLSAGPPGKVAVIATGDVTNGNLVVILRNNTTDAVRDPNLTVAARDASGAVVASGYSKGVFHPDTIEPGQAALGYVFIDTSRLPNFQLPPRATFDFTVETSAPDPQQHQFGPADLKVTDAKAAGDSIVGAAINATGKRVSVQFANVFCFNTSGMLLPKVPGEFTHPGTAEPGETVSFEIRLFRSPCATFIVGVSARYEPKVLSSHPTTAERLVS